MGWEATAHDHLLQGMNAVETVCWREESTVRESNHFS